MRAYSISGNRRRVWLPFKSVVSNGEVSVGFNRLFIALLANSVVAVEIIERWFLKRSIKQPTGRR